MYTTLYIHKRKVAIYFMNEKGVGAVLLWLTLCCPSFVSPPLPAATSSTIPSTFPTLSRGRALTPFFAANIQGHISLLFIHKQNINSLRRFERKANINSAYTSFRSHPPPPLLCPFLHFYRGVFSFSKCGGEKVSSFGFSDKSVRDSQKLRC